jgi:hypothetical protein
MRFVWILRACWWLAAVAFVICAGVTALAGHFRAADAVESAVDVSTPWDKVQLGGAATRTANHTASIREEILANARKQRIPLDPGKLQISQSGRTLFVDVRWAQPIVTAATGPWSRCRCRCPAPSRSSDARP